MRQLVRPRRLRLSNGIRSMVRETALSVNDFIYPIFVVQGQQEKHEIPSLPGLYHYTPDLALEAAREAYDLGIPAVLLFGLPEYKDSHGSAAWAENGPVQQAIRLMKKELPGLVIITDVCLCQYTDHGHCGVINNGHIENDPTLNLLSKVAVSHAQAGADIVAPSDMMDGRVLAIRDSLDNEGFIDVGIMAYSAKYASAFYGPFRDAAGSAPQFGDRRSYQMDPGNSREAIKEVAMDIAEGADFVMVKPALSYLDIVRQVKDTFDLPVVAYNVSGEYAMVKAAAKQGLVDEERITKEILMSIKRAGADIIITYHAIDAARWLQQRDSR